MEDKYFENGDDESPSFLWKVVAVVFAAAVLASMMCILIISSKYK